MADPKPNPWIRLFVLVAVLVAAAVASVAADAPSRRELFGARRLLDASGGSADLSWNPATGTLRLVHFGVDAPEPDLGAAKAAGPEARARAFFERFGTAFGIEHADRQLRHTATQTDQLGWTHVAYEQLHDGYPVFGALLRVHFDARQRLRAVNGATIPSAEPFPPARLAPQQAQAVAVEHLTTPQLGRYRWSPVATRLVVFRENLARGSSGGLHLTYEVELVASAQQREFVYVDAHKGHVVDQITGVHETLDRRVYEGSYGEQFLVWTEGDATPFGDIDIDHLIDYAEDSYNFFFSLSGGTYVAWDGDGAPLESIAAASSLPCPNASWGGSTTNFCDGVTSDDVVAHEWAHAYTGATHGLIYQWQPGALNEAYSDIWGEAIDRLNGDGNDLPEPQRSASQCSTYGGSPPPRFEVIAPAELAGVYSVAGARFGPAPPLTVTASVELAYDEPASASPTDGCEALVGFTPGAIALVDRGSCTFVTKVLTAQSAGASGVIVVNLDGDSVFAMSGTSNEVTIPAAMIGQPAGEAIRDALGGGAVTASLGIDGAADDSLRWLMGEDSPAFGSPIRDLWNPTCFGHPGKVTDGFYHCASSDSGGVHRNSGIPNHAFALLVDGGEYNGITVRPLGLTKAAAIYWRAQTVYQVPATDFADHADLLELSCADLVDAPLFLPVTDEVEPTLATFAIAPDDCVQVALATLAVELRTPPDQCAFEPLLVADAPAACDGGTTQMLYATDWESGLGEWTVGTRALADPATFDTPDWAVVDSLPGARSGRAAFVADLRIGDCNEDLESGVLVLESPDLQVPADALSPRLTFEHWLALERLWDGGNLKLQVNGGPWLLVEGTAFTFNGYPALLNTGAGNPLEGEPAFTGTDEGSVLGSWGESQVDLEGLVAGGDTFRLRFELGLDGCNGIQGWYIDDVRLHVCGCAGGADPADQPVWYRDADGDGFGDPQLRVLSCAEPSDSVANDSDCSDADGSSWATPAEARRLRFGSDPERLVWEAPEQLGGLGVAYEALRVQGPLPIAGPATCLATEATEASDASLPPPGSVWFYLVRALNGCPEPGSLGAGSAGTPRVDVECL